jgi:dTDP-4-dehydrorhamnose reductase
MENEWKQMKLLITGASGLYGSKLAEKAVSNQHEVYAAHNQHEATNGIPIKLDVTNRENVETELASIKPEVIVHAATMTDVDKCELNRELAWKNNVEGTINVARAAKTIGAFLLYISTDYVFDGEKGCYKETDLPSPISYYAYTKLRAEEKVKDISSEYCIARPSVIYGANPAAGKTNFALWVLNKLRNKEQANVFVDQWNSPTLNTNLAEMTLEVIERKLTGVYHLSGASRINRYDFAHALAKTFSLDASLLIPTHMKDLAFPAKRPKDSSLDTTKAEIALRNKPIEIPEALQKLKNDMNSSAKS